MPEGNNQLPDDVGNPFGIPPEQPGYDYGSLWPVRHKVDAQGNQTGPIEWGYWPKAARAVVNDMGMALTAPGNALTGKIPADKMADVAAHASIGMASMGLAGGALAPRGALGVFAGRNSATADSDAMQEAMELEKEGAKAETIHQITGWFRGADSKWRYTIPDSRAKINPAFVRDQDVVNLAGGKEPSFGTVQNLDLPSPVKLKDILHHPDLYEAYPHLADVDVFPTRGNGFAGSFNASKIPDIPSQLRLDTDQSGDEALATTLHEVQHGIQHHENFAMGGNEQQFMPAGKNYDQLRQHQAYLAGDMIRLAPAVRAAGISPAGIFKMIEEGSPQLDELMNDPRIPGQAKQFISSARTHFNQQDIITNAQMSYKHLAGEVEARTVEEQLAQKDWSRLPQHYEGYPTLPQIIKFRGNSFKTEPVEHDPFAELEQEEPFLPFTTNPGKIASEHAAEVSSQEAAGAKAAGEKHKRLVP